MLNSGLLERFFIDFEAYLYPKNILNTKDGFFKLTNEVDLELDPDVNVIKD
jgi:hypothetical protein